MNRYCATCGAGLTSEDAENDLCVTCSAGVMTQDGAGPALSETVASKSGRTNAPPADAATIVKGAASAPIDPFRPQTGQILGDRYEFKRELGRGGMGMVWLAQDTDLNLDVAIKLLPPDIATDRRAQDEMKKEAQRSITLSHPNIVKLHTYRNQGNYQYLVMEFVAGPTLDHYLYDSGPIPEEQLAQWLVDICAGLSEAHHQGVIHRDIKPHNILIGQDGRAKIADFGIARVMTDSTLRATGSISGTPLYMAPEQIRGEQCDARSDLYSLGVMAYQLASGDVPFRSGDVAYQHLQIAPQPIGDKAPRLWPILERLLAKDQADRFESADALVTALVEAGLVEQTRSFSRPAPMPPSSATRPAGDGAHTAATRVMGAATGEAAPASRIPMLAAAAAVVVLGIAVLFGMRPGPDATPASTGAQATAVESAVPTPMPADVATPAPAPTELTPSPEAPTATVPLLDTQVPPAPAERLEVASVSPEQLEAAIAEATAAAKELSPEIARIPASDVLAIAYGAYPPEPPVGTSSPSLQLEIFARREGQDTFTVLKDGDALTSQVDDYVIMARALSAGYLYVFQVDSLGNKYWLFPRNTQTAISGGSNPVPAEDLMQVPGGREVQAMYLDENVGIEHVYAIFSATPWPELEQALADTSDAGAVPPAVALPAGEAGPSKDLLAAAPESPDEPERFEVAMAITEPNRLATRGIGGARPAPASVHATIQFDKDTFIVPISNTPMTAEGHFFVVERWFRHVAPE